MSMAVETPVKSTGITPGEPVDPTAGVPQRPVMFFDGVCGFCNASVDRLLAWDRRGNLLFAPLQGETAGRLLTVSDRENLHSLVLWTPEGLCRRSSAVVKILWLLGGVWGGLGCLLWLVPRPLRDAVYGLIARRRYLIAGKKETCRMPTPAERARFLP